MPHLPLTECSGENGGGSIKLWRFFYRDGSIISLPAEQMTHHKIIRKDKSLRFLLDKMVTMHWHGFCHDPAKKGPDKIGKIRDRKKLKCLGLIKMEW